MLIEKVKYYKLYKLKQKYVPFFWNKTKIKRLKEPKDLTNTVLQVKMSKYCQFFVYRWTYPALVVL